MLAVLDAKKLRSICTYYMLQPQIGTYHVACARFKKDPASAIVLVMQQETRRNRVLPKLINDEQLTFIQVSLLANFNLKAFARY